ncbi:MAG: hypothetical protein ABSC22_11120 [Roseiarcus sp.]
MDIAARLRRRGEALWRAWPAVWAVAAILAAAIAAQARFGAIADVSWMITIGERWLDGQSPYVDFIETNPPVSIVLYLPAVALARMIGARPELVVAAYGFAAVGASLWLSAAILRRAGLGAEVGAIALGLTLAALTILPGRTFDERDFFVALFALPYLALCAARAGRAPVDSRMTLVAGLGLGAMVAIKPPYALIAVALAPYLASRIGVAALLRALEYYVAAAFLAAAAALTIWRFPAYGADVLPTVVAAYLPVRESMLQLFANAGVVVWVALFGLLAAIAGRRVREPLVATPALASLGAAGAFIVQGKGWLYQFYPALALLVVALGAALEMRPQPPRRLAAAGGAAGATAVGALLFRLPPIDCAIGAALAAHLALAAAPPRVAQSSRERVARLAEMTAAALIAAACALYCAPVPGPDAAFARAVADLGPHPRLASVGEGLGVGFPLVRNVGGVWVQRTQGMLMTAGARRLIDQNPHDGALAERLAPIIARDRDMTAEDIERNRPDGVLVSNLGPRFHQWAMSDPKLAAALADYRFMIASGAKDWPIDLYVRADLIGLRPTLSAPDASGRAQ